ncbi:DUF7079 family protein [Xenorhabdus japonica]|uniref:DUF7079 family protein n=1 Tax=Xenorhabdus japonica TaxID=53341 RepID=UPI003BB4D043
MATKLADIDLCESLSYCFVDNQTDYIYIASIARSFPLEHVEMVFFEWIAPICYLYEYSRAYSLWMDYF